MRRDEGVLSYVAGRDVLDIGGIAKTPRHRKYAAKW